MDKGRRFGPVLEQGQLSENGGQEPMEKLGPSLEKRVKFTNQSCCESKPNPNKNMLRA